MLRVKNLFFLIFLFSTAFLIIFPIFLPEKEKAKADEVLDSKGTDQSFFSFFEQNTLLGQNLPPSFKETDVLKRIKVVITAYSSSVWETQGDPFITASGSRVREGIVANNFLPFGTKVRFPELFGDEIFEVQDRMNPKKGKYHVDIWFPSREEALKFGVKITQMEVLKEGVVPKK